ncbi:MAG: hypothetical protein ACJAT7_002238 [Psychromonas sp.]|jgi:hypothetical protein|uniref:hypothetical protein n=1 Tax=Psychromonas sp. TaxID=1884585 RepID=UPI0039E59115
MLLRILIGLSIMLSFPAEAGKVTIEKSDSLMRNDLFDEKRERAEEYKRREAERNVNNRAWSHRLVPECVLLKKHYLIYLCTDGHYYKGYELENRPEYRELSAEEVKLLQNEQ